MNTEINYSPDISVCSDRNSARESLIKKDTIASITSNETFKMREFKQSQKNLDEHNKQKILRAQQIEQQK